MAAGSETVAGRVGSDGTVIERTAGKAEMNPETLVVVLDVLHVERIGRHSNLERNTSA